MKKVFIFLTVLLIADFLHADWQPAENTMMTRWGKQVSPENVWDEYPRPQLEREGWLNLNGLWDYAIVKRNQGDPNVYPGKILVPFCVESALSGVKKELERDERLWYRRDFTVPTEWKGRSIILNFEAVDYSSTVWVNGSLVGSHQGGFDRFSFDITEYLTGQGKQEIVVAVDDPSSYGTQARGKQQTPPLKIWYTTVSGIWQTVWLEAVSKEAWLKEVKIVPDVDEKTVTIVPFVNKPLLPEYNVEISITDGAKQIVKDTVLADFSITLAIDKPILWSPDSPHLYDLKLTLTNKAGQVLDEIRSYFGMRKISLDDHKGTKYLFLNNQPLFHYGTLDQGWWPDGLHTPPSDEAMRYDIEVTKQMGFNMIRKHIKVEPDRWYYHCDNIGILVWQDMPTAMAVIPKDNPKEKPHHVQHVWKRTPVELNRRSEVTAKFEYELRRMIDLHYNAPSIVMWVPFNEGMGQYATVRIADMVKALDPTRLVNPISGWKLYPVGDVYDIHTYGQEVVIPPISTDRATVIGEYGGIGLPIKGHLWNPQNDNWGYQTYEGQEKLLENYKYKFDQIVKMQKQKGLSGAVYTQTTDVETEVNGLMTYDREIIKIPVDILKAMHAELYKD